MKNKGQRGFTLIEIIIVLACLSIMTLPIMYMEVFTAQSVQRDLNRMETAQAAANALDFIGRDFRGSTGTLGEFRGQTSVGGLIIALPGGGAVVYALQEGRLSRMEYGSAPGDGGSGSTLALAEGVAGFRADTTKDGCRIDVSIVLSRPTLRGEDKEEISAVFARRLP